MFCFGEDAKKIIIISNVFVNKIRNEKYEKRYIFE
jgi:hypothetical protein